MNKQETNTLFSSGGVTFGEGEVLPKSHFCFHFYLTFSIERHNNKKVIISFDSNKFTTMQNVTTQFSVIAHSCAAIANLYNLFHTDRIGASSNPKVWI